MPFAKKFVHTFALPQPGGHIGPHELVDIEVGHDAYGDGMYRYPIRLVVKGKGGKQGVLSTIRNMLTGRKTTFSGYGNPYQLWLGKLEASTLAPGVYEVTGFGWGARFDLEKELIRFIDFLDNTGKLTSSIVTKDVYETYFDQYQVATRRKQKME